MPDSTNKKQVKSFIWMINYLSKFPARLSEIVEPIRELAKDEVPFNWAQEHQSTFTQIALLQYWLTIILRSKLSCKLMQA